MSKASFTILELAAQRNFSVAKEYEDRGVSGSKARRPGLDALLADARRKRFDVVLVAAFDRLARSTKHFLEVIDEFNALGIEFISAREGIDSSSPMGRFFTIIVGCMAEAEKCMLWNSIRYEASQIGRKAARKGTLASKSRFAAAGSGAGSESESVGEGARNLQSECLPRFEG